MKFEIIGRNLARVAIGLACSFLCAQAMGASLTSKEKMVVSDSIRKQLTDPDSAIFKWLPLVGKITNADHTASATYCGLVNSKNRMGGYTGDAPFIVFLAWANNKFLSAVVSIGSADWESIESKSIVQNCVANGYENLLNAE